ncbi:phosphate signaling complex protein PhoU [Desulfonatronum thioautotrophicum]|uniref:phosphate signaling complex protein PhoU n=1 Tax=Desulfonatronum thioautotrophicum TaxID=617001 RepID=UPI0005EBCAD7|nr:phosphate signaling complex protein PhoU [Desulfonatronum thioautotrophicum]
MPSRLPFHQELQRMHDHILLIAAAAEESLNKAVQAINQRDLEIAEEVIEADKHINMLECEINEMALQMLALSQPVARDLRFIIGGNWIARNIERVGDQAVNIAERAILLATRPPLPNQDMLSRIAEISVEMYKNAIDAFRGHDEKMARYVCISDEEVDELDVLILRKLIDHMISDTFSAERSVHALLASHCFERVADLSVNIAENAIFIDKGENIKHSCQKL